MKNLSIFIILTFVILSSLNTFSQDISANGGYVINRFYDLNSEDMGYSHSDYTIGGGYHIEFSVYDPFQLNNFIPFKFALSYQQFKGDVEIRDGSKIGYSFSNSSIEVSSLELDWYFACFKLFENLRINAGTSLDLYLKKKTNKEYESITMGETEYKVTIEEESNLLNWGFTSEISYEIKCAEDWYVVPKYRFYINLPSFSSSPAVYRHYFDVGIMKRF